MIVSSLGDHVWSSYHSRVARSFFPPRVVENYRSQRFELLYTFAQSRNPTFRLIFGDVNRRADA